MAETFVNIGYFKEYYVNGKFIGSLNCEKDREIMGYMGRKTETTLTEIVFKKKKIKANTEVITMLFPLCGKTIK